LLTERASGVRSGRPRLDDLSNLLCLCNAGWAQARIRKETAVRAIGVGVTLRLIVNVVTAAVRLDLAGCGRPGQRFAVGARARSSVAGEGAVAVVALGLAEGGGGLRGGGDTGHVS
jgi:hypothetical protein